MSKLRISASSLNSFFESRCPAAWKYSRELERIGPVEDHFARGLTVHSLMDGSIKREEITDKQILTLYDKLITIRRNLSIKAIQTELWQEFDILPGVLWQRRIDMLGTISGKDVQIIDWKVAMGGWKTFPFGKTHKSPMAIGFQSIGYVIPPPDNPDWPRSMMYVVAGFRGPAQTFSYEYSQEDHDNLLSAVKLLKLVVGACERDKHYPKVRGYACKDCKFRELCFNESGWETRFQKKERKK